MTERKSSAIKMHTNTATPINAILILHIAKTSIPPIAAPPGSVPIFCQAFSGPTITVRSPVTRSTDTVPSIIAIITVISIGITKKTAIMI